MDKSEEFLKILKELDDICPQFILSIEYESGSSEGEMFGNANQNFRENTVLALTEAITKDKNIEKTDRVAFILDFRSMIDDWLQALVFEDKHEGWVKSKL